LFGVAERFGESSVVTLPESIVTQGHMQYNWSLHLKLRPYGAI